MKKLMTMAAVALCGAVGFGDGVTSANVVGYQAKETTFIDKNGGTQDNGFQYVTATFRKISGGQVSIQDFQMSAEVTTAESDMQRMDAGGFYTTRYFWVAGDSCEYWSLELPEGANGVWANPLYKESVNPRTGAVTKTLIGYELPTGDEAVVTEGEMFQILAHEGNTINFAGEVAEEDIDFLFDFTGEMNKQGEQYTSGFRYIGNAYPQDMSVQNFQMNAEMTTAESDMQRMDCIGYYTTRYFWVAGDSCEYWGLKLPEGANGVWANPLYKESVNPRTGAVTKTLIGYELPTGDEAIVKSGDGVQILGKQGSVCTLLCPYQLTK